MSLLLLFKSGSSGGAVLGSGDATFDAMTGAASGGAGASGSADTTFAAMTGSATGTLPITGTSATTFGSMSGSAEGSDDTVYAEPDVIVRVTGRHGANPHNRYTILGGGLVTHDPSAELVYRFDWDAEALGAEASILTSTFTVTAVRPSTATAMTAESASIFTGDRMTQVKLSGGTLGATYRIDNTIETDESPSQTKNLSFKILIQRH